MRKPELVDDWRSVLRHSWTVRLILLAAVFQGLEVAMPLLQYVLPVRPRTFAILSGLATSAAFVSRFIAQRQLSKRK